MGGESAQQTGSSVYYVLTCSKVGAIVIRALPCWPPAFVFRTMSSSVTAPVLLANSCSGDSPQGLQLQGTSLQLQQGFSTGTAAVSHDDQTTAACQL